MDEAKLTRAYHKMLLVEDCLRRALDQLEDDRPDVAGWSYVRKQVENADDFLTDAKCAYLAALENLPHLP